MLTATEEDKAEEFSYAMAQRDEQDETQALIPGLPDDTAFTCIARVSRCFHPNISLVSKAWRRLLRSQELASFRFAHNLKEERLHLMIKIPAAPSSAYSYAWFVLQEHQSRRYSASLPQMPVKPVGAACVTFGTKLFMIGGSVNEIPTCDVWAYDSLTTSWSSAASMSVPREFAAAGTIAGKIYVIGGCKPTTRRSSTCWAQVYDPLLQTWNSIPSPPEMRGQLMHGSAVLGGKLIAMADRGGVVYDPVNNSWDNVSARLDNGWRGRAAVVDGILYSYDYLGKIKGYDPNQNRWLTLQGVQEHLPSFLLGATLANVGGKLYVVWEGHGANNRETDLVCAALQVDRDSVGTLNGTILWTQVILSVPRQTSIIQCVSVPL